jgi:hypothetical protein
MRHLLVAAVYAACLGLFFGSLLREDFKSGLRLFLMLFGVMVVGVYAFGWLMMLLSR